MKSVFKNSENITAIQSVIAKKETECLKFQPSPSFYRNIRINHRRWAKLVRGELIPTISELKSISKYFDVPITELIED